MISFKHFLAETQMDTSELIDKRARGGEYDDQWRTAILKTLIDNGIPLTLKDGSKITIDSNHPDVKSLLAKIKSDERIVGDDADELKVLLKKPIFHTVDDKVYRLSQIKKSVEFGGEVKGSGGGAADTTKNESLQCVALALACNSSEKITDENFNSDEIEDVNDKFDISLSYKDEKELVDLLLSDKSWSEVYIKIANALKTHCKLTTKFNFYHQNDWVSELYSLASDLNKVDGKPFRNMNKWNPADIWIVKGSIKIPECESLIELNEWLYDKFKKKEVIGISLKKTSTATIKETNLDNAVSSLTEIDVINFIIAKSNKLFSAKDAYIEFDDNKIQFRTDQKDKVVNIQGEILGKLAAHGKIGFGKVQDILSTIELSPLDDAKTLKSLINSNETDNAKRLEKLSDKMAEYIHSIDPSLSHSEIINQFTSSANTNSDGWVASKLQAVQLISILKATTKEKQQEFVLHALAFASSQTELSSVYIKVS
jgi:hypothetical protein